MASDKPKHGALSALFEEAESTRIVSLRAEHDAFVESLLPKIDSEGTGALADRFIVPPFSVLDTQQPRWHEKQTKWIPVFDPVLCEIVYRWAAPVKGGHFLDPFGDSTRAIVAGCMGYEYTGFEPNPEKVKAHERQALLVRPNYPHMKLPRWICAHPEALDEQLPSGELYDLVFTDFPVYHPDQATSECMARYEKIFRQAISHLKQNRFVVVMARAVHGQDGFLQFTPEETVKLLTVRLGLPTYNRLVLSMSGGRHEMLNQFWKGENDDKAIPQELGILGGEEERHAARVRITGPAFHAGRNAKEAQSFPETQLTPVETHDGIAVKRDDLFEVAGVHGGKARTCFFLAQGAKGLVTAGSRSSPQVNIVAHIAKHLGVPARAHTPEGVLSPELVEAQACGCEIVRQSPGHNSVIIARAREDAKARGWTEIPFGMECLEAVRQTRRQVNNLPRDIKRIVMPVGSGMSLAGVLWGLQDIGLPVPVIGIVVGASAEKRLNKYAPANWRSRVTLVNSGSDYHEEKPAVLGSIVLDPIYEAKCLPSLKPGDLLWIVGIRRTAKSFAASTGV